jgi:membrane-bound metal-dependent hydrolase YbcI (DUF457 family)
MASYRGHLMFAAPLGAAYGSLALLRPEPDWGPAVLAAGLTTLGGLMPDLDSDSGVPVRELFGVSAAVIPALMYQPLRDHGLPLEQTLVLLGCVYLLIRYVAADLFRRWTVHRGMFHSIPALLIAGLVVWLLYPNPDPGPRLFLAGGVMLGFLSHLVLDELCSVDFMGARLRLNKYAGSALKFRSPSRSATLTAYLILAGLGVWAWYDGPPAWPRWPAAGPHASQPRPGP